MNLPIKENKEHVIQWSLPDGHGTFSEGSFKGNFSLSGAAIVINVEPDKQYELKWGELLDFVKAGGVETDTLLREENEKLKDHLKESIEAKEAAQEMELTAVDAYKVLKDENEKLKAEIAGHQLALADAQFQGFHAGKTEGNIIRLIEAMGLSKEEWEKWKEQFPVYPINEELEEINEHFNS